MRTLIIVCAMCTITSIVCAQPAKGLAKEKVFEVLEDEMKNTSQTVNVSLGDNPCFIDFTVSQSVFPYVMASNGVEVKREAGKETCNCKATVTMTGDGLLTEDSKTSFGSQAFTYENGYDDLREKINMSVDQSVKSLSRVAKIERNINTDRKFVSMPPTSYMGESALYRSVPFDLMKKVSEVLSKYIAKYSELVNDTVCVTMCKSDLYRLTSEGQKTFTSECYYTIYMAMYCTPSDGGRAKRHVSTVRISEQALKDRFDDVRQTVLRHVDDIASSCHAEKVSVGFEYDGPVLLEEEAVWPSLFESHAAQSALAFYMRNNKYEIGQNVCHPSVSISQVGDMSMYQGNELLGYYAADADGEKAQNVCLVENGKLKAKLAGRIIGDEGAKPTGNMRFSSSMMSPSLRYGVLQAATSATQTKAAIRRHFIEEAKKKGLKKAYIMRSYYDYFVLLEYDISAKKERVLNADCHIKARGWSEDDEFSQECYIQTISPSTSMSSLIYPETMLLKQVKLVIEPKATLRNWENNFTPKNKKFGL